MLDGIALWPTTVSPFAYFLAARADGSYLFRPVSRKQEVVELDDKKELLANLGGGLATKLDGELAQGWSLDVAMTLIGKKRATVRLWRARRSAAAPPVLEPRISYAAPSWGPLRWHLVPKARLAAQPRCLRGKGEAARLVASEMVRLKLACSWQWMLALLQTHATPLCASIWCN